MTTLYNCKHSGDQYCITKFKHGEVESSYLCNHVDCTCPAGVRDTCRHRQMLPMFLEEGLVNTNLFLNWDRRSITDFNGLPAVPPSHDLAPQAHTDTCTQDSALTDTYASTKPLEPTDILSPGDVYSSYDLSVDMFTKDVTPANPQPAATTKPWRRF